MARRKSFSASTKRRTSEACGHPHTGSNHKVQQYLTFIAYQMELEAEEPAHRALAMSGNAFECLVDMYPPVFAHTQRCAVHEAAARALPGSTFKRVPCHHCIKKLAEIICHTK